MKRKSNKYVKRSLLVKNDIENRKKITTIFFLFRISWIVLRRKTFNLFLLGDSYEELVFPLRSWWKDSSNYWCWRGWVSVPLEVKFIRKCLCLWPNRTPIRGTKNNLYLAQDFLQKKLSIENLMEKSSCWSWMTRVWITIEISSKAS